jgi:SAM-dependent methyltransferase
VSTNFVDYLHYGWQLLNGFRSSGEKLIAGERDNDIAPYTNGRNALRVLDLGNGSLRPQYTLLQTAGHLTYGIDLVNRPEWNSFNAAYGFARLLYRWKLGVPQKDWTKTLVCGDVTCLPFPEESFDLVTSVAAFEHFLHVPHVVSEVARVLRPGGLVYARIHLFTSLSGGHNVRVAEVPLRYLPKGVEPWDHLRRRRLPFDVPLNEWRQGQYLAEFTKHFEVLKHYCAMREGEHLLTPQIENELSNYSRDELTCGAYVIVARKLDNHPNAF